LRRVSDTGRISIDRFGQHDHRGVRQSATAETSSMADYRDGRIFAGSPDSFPGAFLRAMVGSHKTSAEPGPLCVGFFCGRQLAKYYLFHKWLPYIRTNRFRSTFLILEQQIKNRMSQIEKKIGELEGLRERTNTFSSPEGQSTVQGTLDSAVSSLKETHKEFNAQWWNLQLFLWFNRITGIGVKGNQDGMKNNVERVEEFTYLGHHYINQLKKDKQLTAEKSEALRGRVQKGIELLKKIQEVVVAQEAETLIKQVKPLGEGFPEELSIEGKISFLCTDAAQVSLESFTDVIERLDQEYSRLSIERKIANDTKSLMRE